MVFPLQDYRFYYTVSRIMGVRFWEMPEDCISDKNRVLGVKVCLKQTCWTFLAFHRQSDYPDITILGSL